MTKSVKVWNSPEDLPWVIGRGLCDFSSRRIRWGLCVIRFKYLAAPTRRTIVTAVGTGLPNHCLHQANWFYFLNPFIFHIHVLMNLIMTVWRLWLKTFSISSILILQSHSLQPAYHVFMLFVLSAYFHFIMMTMLLLCYDNTWLLIPLLVCHCLGISSPRNSLVKNL